MHSLVTLPPPVVHRQALSFAGNLWFHPRMSNLLASFAFLHSYAICVCSYAIRISFCISSNEFIFFLAIKFVFLFVFVAMQFVFVAIQFVFLFVFLAMKFVFLAMQTTPSASVAAMVSSGSPISAIRYLSDYFFLINNIWLYLIKSYHFTSFSTDQTTYIVDYIRRWQTSANMININLSQLTLISIVFNWHNWFNWFQFVSIGFNWFQLAGLLLPGRRWRSGTRHSVPGGNFTFKRIETCERRFLPPEHFFWYSFLKNLCCTFYRTQVSLVRSMGLVLSH